MMENFVRFLFWFFIELMGSWVIWASYMAIKFISEDAQGQKAAWSLIHTQNVGAAILFPILANIVWTVASIGIAATIDL